MWFRFRVRSFFKYWLPILAWLIFIFISSTDLMSAEHTSRFIGPVLRWFDPKISEATIASVQLLVRKCAHLTEYAIFAALLFRPLRQNQQRLFRAAMIALVVAAICAALDEFHQSFVASRTASPWDVALDCLGAGIGVVFFYVLARRRNRKSPIENRK